MRKNAFFFSRENSAPFRARAKNSRKYSKAIAIIDKLEIFCAQGGALFSRENKIKRLSALLYWSPSIVLP